MTGERQRQWEICLGGGGQSDEREAKMGMQAGKGGWEWFVTRADGKCLLMSASQQDTQEESSCLLYTSPSPRDRQKSRMPSSA